MCPDGPGFGVDEERSLFPAVGMGWMGANLMDEGMEGWNI